MRQTLVSFFFLFLLFSENCLSTGFAQEYTRFSLPEETDPYLKKEGSITAIHYSPNGHLLAVVSRIGVWLYTLDSNEALPHLTRHIEKVSSVAFSPDGRMLAGSTGSDIRLWDLETGRLKQDFKGHTDFVWSLAFNPDGQTLASASRDQTIRVWEVKTGDLAKSFVGHIDEVLSVAFSPDGQTLASGSWDATVRLWDVQTGKFERRLKGYSGNINNVAFSPDGQTLASVNGKHINVRDVQTGTDKRQLKAHTGAINTLAFSPDGKTLASAGWDKIVLLWDPKTGEHKYPLIEHTASISSLAFSPDGQTLASASGKEILLWDISKIVDGTKRKKFRPRANREGFIWGLGIGTGMASYTQSLVEYWGDAYEGTPVEARGNESAFVTNFRAGHGLTDQVLFYYTSRIAWIPLRNLYRDTVIANGTAGLGVTIYPYAKSRFYIEGSVGLTALATWFPPIQLENARPTGISVSAGIGYEFVRHSSIDLTVSFGNASRTQIDERNYVELTNEVVTVLLTLNGLAY